MNRLLSIPVVLPAQAPAFAQDALGVADGSAPRGTVAAGVLWDGSTLRGLATDRMDTWNTRGHNVETWERGTKQYLNS